MVNNTKKVHRVKIRKDGSIIVPKAILENYPLSENESFVFVSVKDNDPDAVVVRKNDLV